MVGVHLQTWIAMCCFACCSVGMLVFNKMAVSAFPLQCTLVSLQMTFTVFAMLVFFPTLHFGSMRDVLRWSMVAPFFTGMLLTSILSLKHAPMSLLVVFRVFSPLLSLFCERLFPNPLSVSKWMMLSVCAMVAGTTLYARDMSKSDMSGIPWICVNMIIAVADRLVQRVMLAKDQCPVDISLTGITLISNLWGTIFVTLAAAITGEFAMVPSTVAALTSMDKVWIFFSCVVGAGISFCGVWTQKLISATSFLVMVNVNKFAIILAECSHTLSVAMGHKALTPTQIFAALITILAGVGYGKAREACEHAQEPEKKPIMPK